MVSSSMESRVKDLIKNKDMFYIFITVAFALAIRIYYLVITTGQTLWWDEAEYMSAAKHWAFDVPYNLNEQRPPIFQLLAALFLKVGFGENSLKFLLVVVPSVCLVFATYLLGKEMFGKKIGLISSLGTGLVWSILFWSSRFQPDFFSVTIQLLAVLFFWKFVKSDGSNPRFAIYAGLLCALAFYFKISALLVPLSMFVFALYLEGFKLFAKKNYWLILGSFIVGLIPFMIWQAISFGNPLAFGETYSGDFNEGRAPGWMTFYFYSAFLKPFALILFLFGAGATLWKFAFNVDLLYKDKKLRKDPHIFSLVVLLVITLFYIFYIRGTIEDRWVFLIIPFCFFFVSKSLIFLESKISKYSKIASAVFMAIVLLVFALPQLDHTNSLIDGKKESYMPVKDASLIIKSNSEPTDKVLSVSYTQTTNYAEREVITYARMDIENFTKILKEQKPKFVMASIIEPNHPTWMVQQVQNEEGYYGILFPYFNASIIVSPQGQLVQYDLKEKIIINKTNYTLIYPIKGSDFGGLVVYRIDY